MPVSLLELGLAFSPLGQYDEALKFLNKVIAERPYWITARGQLIMTLVGLGRIETATRQAVGILKISPKFTVGSWARDLPYRNAGDLELYFSAL